MGAQKKNATKKIRERKDASMKKVEVPNSSFTRPRHAAPPENPGPQI